MRDMFDTMTLTKITGGLCGMFLVFLLGNWAAETIYHVGSDGHGDGHGDAPAQAYIIDTGDDGHGDDNGDAEPEVPFAEVLAAADVAAGEKEFKACKSCHKIEDGKNGTGPHLYGIVGRATASVDGFGYSGKLIAVTPTWDAEALNAFLENPKGYAPGTKMSYKGMKDVEDRANLIAWLDSLDN